MKVAVLSSRVPHARSTSGHQIVYQRMMRLMDRGYKVGLIALEGRQERVSRDPLLERLEECVTVAAPERGDLFQRALDYVRSPVPPPFWPFRSPTMGRELSQMLTRGEYDVLLVEFAPMGQYVYQNPDLPSVRKIISTHECASMVARTPLMLAERTWWRAAREHLIKRDITHYEFAMYRSVDQVWTLSQEDRFTLLSHAPDLRVSVVPGGIDLDYFRPAKERTSAQSLVFTAQFRDETNRDAFTWFVTKVWPSLKARHPDLLFYVLGPGPTPAMRDLAAHAKGVDLVGEVRDIRPYLARANAFVCPVRMGSGLRVKILEAMAAEVPVVTTTAASMGIPVQNGINALLADEPTLMADAIDFLLHDPALAQRLARNAALMVRERFHWDRSMDRLEKALNPSRNGRQAP